MRASLRRTLLLLVATGTLAGCGHHASPTASTAPATTPVPSQSSIGATFPASKAHSTPQVTRATAPMVVRPGPCSGGALRATPGFSDGAAGHQHQVMVVTNHGTRCTLEGYPALQLRTDAGTPVALTQSHDGDVAFPATAPRPVVLAAGQEASFDLGYSDVPSGDEQSCPNGTTLVITPPHTAAVSAKVALAPCDHGHLAVSPFVAGARGSNPQR